ncbi:hypothetical protein CC78DRAFT_43799 [Lojkania enalia]|uniref:F-box domain-containing protein n=1 Tax=Lojkania enalia TaxID=147567 RepID=A0A9P4K0F3_9PLEO|nr:hypothetical protein CC78DRAFT_43799 [Didymosphaeria enalia]
MGVLLPFLSAFIRAGFLSLWQSYFSFLVTLAALIIPALILVPLLSEKKNNSTPFRFLDLPPELRVQVYSYLLDDPHYPPPPPSKAHRASALSWIQPCRRWVGRRKGGSKRCNWMFLANRQIYVEFMDMLCRNQTFHLTISPRNYNPAPTFPACPSTNAAANANPNTNRIWHISPTTLSRLRKCELKLITTSSMLGVSDPRNMASASWPLAKRVRRELKHVRGAGVDLRVRAIGDPLWNPLWVWYHACCAFKGMGECTDTGTDTPAPTSPSPNPNPNPSPEARHQVEAQPHKSPTHKQNYLEADTRTQEQCPGPRFHRITFSLDTWSPGENYMERDGSGRWAWRCMKGHFVGRDSGEMGVREFCARLYAECGVCGGGK